jgi:hypothetical protein
MDFVKELVAEVERLKREELEAEANKVRNGNIQNLLKALEAGNYNAAPTELKQGSELTVSPIF